MSGGASVVDLSQYASLAGLAFLLGVVMQVFKAAVPLSEDRKRALPGLTVLLGIALAVLVGYTLGQIRSGQEALGWVVGGFLAGAAEIGVYEAGIKPAKTALGLRSGPPEVTIR